MSLTLGRKTANRSLFVSPARLWQAFQARYARIAQANRLKRELARMDPRMLSDMGISRAQMGFELEAWERKRF